MLAVGDLVAETFDAGEMEQRRGAAAAVEERLKVLREREAAAWAENELFEQNLREQRERLGRMVDAGNELLANARARLEGTEQLAAEGEFAPNLKGAGRRRVPPVLQMESVECGAACLGMILTHGALIWLQRTLLARMATKLAMVASVRFVWHVVSLPMQFFSQRSLGDIASRIASNDTVARLLSDGLAVNLLRAAVYGVAMFAYDVPLSLAVTAFVAVNLVVMRLTARYRDIANRNVVKDHGRLAGASVAGIDMIETLKGTGAEDDFLARRAGIQANLLGGQHRVGTVERATRTRR